MPDPPSQYIYPITTGRSGTVFLSKLLRQNLPAAEVHHEFAGFPHFGLRTPDASHLTTFNHVGNTTEVRAFWRRKFGEDMKSKARIYAEVSHSLAKAGMIENLDLLPANAMIDLIRLKRDPFKIYWSYLNRYDFKNTGFTWLFSLDANYPNVIVDAEAFLNKGVYGRALWYVYEMFARAAYYERLMADNDQVRFHRVRLEDLVRPEGAARLLGGLLGAEVAPEEVSVPAKENALREENLGSKERAAAEAVFKRISCDPELLGERYYDEGLRLGTPVHLFLRASAEQETKSLPPPLPKKQAAASKSKANQQIKARDLKVRGLAGGGDLELPN